MEKITTGIKNLDGLLDSVYMGDNVVWEIEAGTSVELFISSFVRSSLEGDSDVIYVSINKSPQTVLSQLTLTKNLERLTIIDCFTEGKGKGDPAFLKFYNSPPAGPRFIKLESPADIRLFTQSVNRMQESARPGARYVFDSLTGMQDLWGGDAGTYKFFTYMCPRLYDLNTVAYWVLEKEAHSQSFKANVRHITQVVLNLSKRRDRLFIKAVKLDRRIKRDAFEPHEYGIDEHGVYLISQKDESLPDIGGAVKAARAKLGMSQKELADELDVTPGYISQLESNHTSPSLASFFQLCSVLKINPASLMKKKGSREPSWHIGKDSVMSSLVERGAGFEIFRVLEHDKGGLAAWLVRVEPDSVIGRPFLQRKCEEFVQVLKGSIAVTVGGTAKTLDEGDSAHFMDHLPAQWKAQGKGPVEILIICKG